VFQEGSDYMATIASAYFSIETPSRFEHDAITIAELA
jgi:hypothetical protein